MFFVPPIPACLMISQYSLEKRKAQTLINRHHTDKKIKAPIAIPTKTSLIKKRNRCRHTPAARTPSERPDVTTSELKKTASEADNSIS